MAKTHDKWYAQGLRFECLQCGRCCSGEPGYVWVTPQEIRKIAAFLGCEDEQLEPRYLRRVGTRFSLTEMPNGDCVFLARRNGRAVCAIYPVRPLQCRTWPFWRSNLTSAARWAEVARTCPGMNRGAHYDAAAIEELRNGENRRNG